MLDPKKLQELEKIFQVYPEILAVYVFGSAISGKTHLESDLDLAVWPRDAKARQRKLDILADLVRQGFDKVDLVFLDTADIVLRYEAVKHNRLVYQAEGFDRGSAYSLVVRQYLDFLPTLKVQRQAYKRRVLHDQQGSGTQAPD